MSEFANGHPRDRLSAYLDDELPVDGRAVVDRHLAQCAACRDELPITPITLASDSAARGTKIRWFRNDGSGGITVNPGDSRDSRLFETTPSSAS